MDVMASVCAMMIFCIIVLCIMIIFGLVPTKDVDTDSNLFLVYSFFLFSLPIIHRVRSINSLLTQGLECNAEITNFVSGYQADGIWYEYEIDGQLFKKYYAAIFYKCKVKIGDNVTVVVDKNNYKRSKIKCLFL